jgi:hypothetical protein
MSIEVFEKAKEMALKIFVLHQYMDGLPEKGIMDFEKYAILSVQHSKLHIKKDYDEESRNILVLTRDEVPAQANTNFNIDNSYIVLTDRDYFCSKNKMTKRLIPMNEFDEAWDFQCQTVFDDTDLFQYYLFCALKSWHLKGIVIRRMDDEMINLLEVALKEEYKEVHG